ncbi:hypothetical protein KBD34_00170 [Patescibacteria group bacterium]|nr:hypothetical protein [Patescibacteria group bacterium]
MKHIGYLFGVLGAFTLIGAGCSAPKANLPLSQDFSVQYTANGCYGTCPVYSIKLKADGRGEYQGVEYVETKGTQPLTVSQKSIERLAEEVKRIHFFSLPNDYISDQTGDLPRWSIQVTEHGNAKTITYNSGTENLRGLARLIEETAQTESLISTKIDPATCVQQYSNLKRELNMCQTDLTDLTNLDEETRFAQRIEDLTKREILWRRIVASPDTDKRWMGIALMGTSTSHFYVEEWDQTVVAERKKSPSGKQTLVVFGQKYDQSSPLIQRGFYILNDKGNLVGTYVVPDAWEHFSIGDVAWKNERTISYNYYLATEGDEITPPEKREYSVNSSSIETTSSDCTALVSGCYEALGASGTNIQPATTTALYSNSSKGLSIKLPYNASWGTASHTLPPYEEDYSRGEKRSLEGLSFGPIIQGEGGLGRQMGLTFEQATSVRSIFNDLSKRGLEFNSSDVRLMKINTLDAVGYIDTGLCGGPILIVQGKKFNYRLGKYCSQGNINELVEIAKTIKLLP